MTDQPQRVSRCASLALGLASTALPFANGAEDEAERWLRILRTHGEASVILASVGLHEQSLPDDPGEPTVELSQANGLSFPEASGKVTEQALRNAAVRGAVTVTTEDLLVGVMKVYGRAFDHALYHHGADSGQLRELLGLDPIPQLA